MRQPCDRTGGLLELGNERSYYTGHHPCNKLSADIDSENSRCDSAAQNSRRGWEHWRNATLHVRGRWRHFSYLRFRSIWFPGFNQYRGNDRRLKQCAALSAENG